MTPQIARATKLADGQLITNSATILYTAPAVGGAIVNSIVLHNTHSSAVTVELWITPDATATADRYKFLKISLAADATELVPFSPIMDASDDLHAQASVTNKVSLHLSGCEFADV